jgi:hypothetical protein
MIHAPRGSKLREHIARVAADLFYIWVCSSASVFFVSFGAALLNLPIRLPAQANA